MQGLRPSAVSRQGYNRRSLFFYIHPAEGHIYEVRFYKKGTVDSEKKKASLSGWPQLHSAVNISCETAISPAECGCIQRFQVPDS
jgi:hypothetical protein